MTTNNPNETPLTVADESTGLEDLAENAVWCGSPDCRFCEFYDLIPKTFEETNDNTHN